MVQSTDVLDLLHLLDKIGMEIGWLWGYLHDESEAGNIPRILDAAEIQDAQELRTAVSKIVNAKQEPLRVRELSDEAIQELVDILGDAPLDEYFTLLELRGIPEIVKRWKKLRAVPVVLVPGEKVAAYLRQATTCYLYGLPTAAAALCRTVLEFVLEEKLGDFGGISKPQGNSDRNKDRLFNLIKTAGITKVGKTKILSDPLVGTAHKIREVGNKAIHASSCTEGEALETIKNTGKILTHFYGRTGTGTSST